MSAAPGAGVFHPLERIDRLHDGYVRAFDVDGLHLVLVQQGGVPSVLEGHCPHAGYPLDDARIVASGIRCDMHGYVFDVRTGACIYRAEGPCRALHVHVCEVRDGLVGVCM